MLRAARIGQVLTGTIPALATFARTSANHDGDFVHAATSCKRLNAYRKGGAGFRQIPVDRIIANGNNGKGFGWMPGPPVGKARAIAA